MDTEFQKLVNIKIQFFKKEKILQLKRHFSS